MCNESEGLQQDPNYNYKPYLSPVIVYFRWNLCVMYVRLAKILEH